MRRYRQGSHSKHDLKVHLIWVPKYRKRVLRGPVAMRARDLIRQIAMEHDLHIISGKVASDHVHVFISYRPMQTAVYYPQVCCCHVSLEAHRLARVINELGRSRSEQYEFSRSATETPTSPGAGAAERQANPEHPER